VNALPDTSRNVVGLGTDVMSLTDDQARARVDVLEPWGGTLLECVDALQPSRAARRRPAYEFWIFELEDAVFSAFRKQPGREDHYQVVLANPDSLDAVHWAYIGLMDAILEGWDVFVRSQVNRAQRRALAFGRRWRRPRSDRLRLGDLVDDTGPPGHAAAISPISSNAPPAYAAAPLHWVPVTLAA
jgi:hypothetical protein